MRLSAFDRFCLNGLAVMVAGMLAVAGLTHETNPDYGKPVKLYRKAEPADWLTVLEAELNHKEAL